MLLLLGGIAIDCRVCAPPPMLTVVVPSATGRGAAANGGVATIRVPVEWNPTHLSTCPSGHARHVSKRVARRVGGDMSRRLPDGTRATLLRRERRACVRRGAWGAQEGITRNPCRRTSGTQTGRKCAALWLQVHPLDRQRDHDHRAPVCGAQAPALVEDGDRHSADTENS